MTDAALPTSATKANPGFIRRALSSSFTFPLLVIAIYLIVAVIGPMVLPYNPRANDLFSRLLPPGATTDSGTLALLGTDAAGRDIFTQIVLGARLSISIGIAAILVAAITGMIFGLIAGYFRGWLDTIMVRLIDVQLSLPPILLAILLAGAFGRSLLNLVLALSITRWVAFARVARAETMSLRERDWVLTARISGLSTPHILMRHVFPFLVGPMIALATVEFAFVILAEAALSFLGLGLPPEASSWGQIIANGKDYLNSAWWISALPGLALAGLVIAVGLLGDRLTQRYSGNRN